MMATTIIFSVAPTLLTITNKHVSRQFLAEIACEFLLSQKRKWGKVGHQVGHRKTKLPILPCRTGSFLAEAVGFEPTSP